MQAYTDVLQNRFFRNFPIFTGKHLCWSLYLKKTSAHVFSCEYCEIVWQYTSGGIYRSSLLNQRQYGMVYTKKGRSRHSSYTLLVETISTRFYWLTCRNQKLAQNKAPQQSLFHLILRFWGPFLYILIAYISWMVAQTPIRRIIFWKTVIKTFRSICVNCFNTLRFLAETSTKLQKMHFFGQFKDHNSGRKYGNYSLGQNIWNKLEKSSKTGQIKKSLMSTFAVFLTAIPKV